jgi:hypothetical protein
MFREEAIVKCGRLIHVAVEALNDALGEITVDWESNKASVCAGVRRVIENPNETQGQNHIAWMAYKLNEGWVYGPVKDPVAKTHPCLVPFEQLPPVQRAKDLIFLKIVREFFELQS